MRPQGATLKLNGAAIAVALTSLFDVEICLAESTNLPRRQVEVCARILLGFSRELISSDLGIGMETVHTHRKRAYQRLRVTSEQELVDWYARLSVDP